MNVSIQQSISSFHCKMKLRVLVYSWVSGLILGAVLAVSSGNLLDSTMRAAVSGSMSISGLIAVQLLPLLLSAYAVYYTQPVLLVSVIFLKAFLFAYAGAGILILYPVSGWLIRSLLMFSDILTIPVLWFIWICVVPAAQYPMLRRIAVSALWSVLVGCVDMTLIAPFLARLI